MKEEKYIKMQTGILSANAWSDVARLSAGGMSSLMHMASRMNEFNFCFLVSRDKKKIAAEMETTVATLDNFIQNLLAVNSIKRVERGVYMINPLLYTHQRGVANKYLYENWESLAGEKQAV